MENSIVISGEASETDSDEDVSTTKKVFIGKQCCPTEIFEFFYLTEDTTCLIFSARFCDYWRRFRIR